MSRIFVLLLCVMFAAQAKDFGTYGTTFPIVEENLIEYFKRKLPQPDIAQMQKSAEIPKVVEGITHTQTERTFFFDPTYTLNEDILDHQGQVIHKAGTKVNPLDHVSWGTEMVFIDGDDEKAINWLKNRVGLPEAVSPETSRIVLVKGSPTKLEGMLGVDAYFDQGGKIVEQLGIKQVPAIITQEGKLLKIMEVKI